MTAGLKQQIANLSKTVSGEDDAARHRAAVGSWSAMVGAVILARMTSDSALSDEILRETAAWLQEKAQQA